MFATIDIGTNAVLLLVGRWKGKGLEVLWDEARITRLGESLHKFHQFIPAARKRTLEVLKEYRHLCDSYGVKKIAAVGTAAFRKAINADEFVDEVKKETGIQIEITTGSREAQLSFLSVTHDFGNDSNLYALDIGGGSTEIISKDLAVSWEIGAVILTERILKNDPPTEQEIKKIQSVIEDTIDLPSPAGLPPTLVGLAGSVTTLSAIRQKLEVWNGAKVQGSILTLADLDGMIDLFRRTTNEERRTIPGMVKGREDTILAGTLILKAVMERLGADQVIVSDRGLRYGLFYERFSALSGHG